MRFKIDLSRFLFPGTRVERLVISGVWQSDIDKEADEYGRKAFDAAKQAVSGIVEPTEEVLLQRDPAKEIIDYLDDNPGTHMFLGRGGDSLVRSLTPSMIRHNSCEKQPR